MNAFFYDAHQELFSGLEKKPDVGIPPIPPHLKHPEQATQYGHTYLWVVTVIMALSCVAFLFMTIRASYRNRLVPVTSFFITLIAAIAYFSMATGIGKTVIEVGLGGKHHTGHPREFFYARYIDWALTTPLLLFDLALLAGLAVGEVIVLVLVDEVMIITGVLSGVHPTKTGTWGLFAVSCGSFVYIVWQLVTSLRSAAFLRNARVGQLYNKVSLALTVIWTLYPIAFGLSEGSGKITVDNEILFFAILDIIAKPLWGTWILLATPDAGCTLLPQSMCAPIAGSSSGGYGAVAHEPRTDDA